MLRCSFCERTEDQVERIIYGASGCICNDCIVACIPDADGAGRQQPPAKNPKASKRKISMSL